MGTSNIDPNVIFPEFTWKLTSTVNSDQRIWTGKPKDPSQWMYKCLEGQGITATFNEYERDLSGGKCYGKGGGGFFFSLLLNVENSLTFVHGQENEEEVGELRDQVSEFQKALQDIDDHRLRVSKRKLPPGQWVEVSKKIDLKVGDVITATLGREIIISEQKDGNAHLVCAFTSQDSGTYRFQANVPGSPVKDPWATVTKINSRGVYVEINGTPCRLISPLEIGRSITHGWVVRTAEEPTSSAT